MDVNILSAADTHLGCRQYGLRAREKDMERSFESLLNAAVNYDAVTISGDMLDSTRPLPRTIEFLKRMNQKLISIQKKCLVTIGNHDLVSPHWISILETESEFGFKLLDNRMEDIKGVKIYGCTFTDKKSFDQGDHIPEDTDLLLMHQSFTNFIGFPSKSAFEPANLQGVHAQIVVIGDTHVHKMFEMTGARGRMQVWSPGSTEVISRSEEYAKYALGITFNDGKLGKVCQEALVTRKCMNATVMSEAALTALQNTLSGTDQELLVFVEFSSSVENVMPRLRSVVDPEKVILRPYPISKLMKQAKEKSVTATDVTMADIATEFFPKNTALRDAGLKCLDAGADVPTLLDDLILTRKKELENV